MFIYAFLKTDKLPPKYETCELVVLVICSELYLTNETPAIAHGNGVPTGVLSEGVQRIYDEPVVFTVKRNVCVRQKTPLRVSGSLYT